MAVFTTGPARRMPGWRPTHDPFQVTIRVHTSMTPALVDALYAVSLVSMMANYANILIAPIYSVLAIPVPAVVIVAVWGRHCGTYEAQQSTPR